MNEYERILQLVQELRERLDQLETEVNQLRTAPPSGERSLMAGAGSPYDLSKVIPPTRTDEPDSIVGGQPTRGFPDCVALGNGSRYFCSGTLIAPNLVVTARHCATAGITQVFVGGYDVNQPETGKIVGVKRDAAGKYAIYEHPEADLMVVVLEHDSKISPRHIAQGDEIAQSDTKKAYLVGFGTIDFDGTKGFGLKRRVTVPITTLGCEEPGQYGCKQGTEMVAGHRGLSKDSCRGDSGGPLYIQGPEGDYYLLGATSRGISGPGLRTCGDGGIYVRVDQFVEWIREQTGVDVPGPLL